jgi:hypothetical protein
VHSGGLTHFKRAEHRNRSVPRHHHTGAGTATSNPGVTCGCGRIKCLSRENLVIKWGFVPASSRPLPLICRDWWQRRSQRMSPRVFRSLARPVKRSRVAPVRLISAWSMLILTSERDKGSERGREKAKERDVAEREGAQRTCVDASAGTLAFVRRAMMMRPPLSQEGPRLLRLANSKLLVAAELGHALQAQVVVGGEYGVAPDAEVVVEDVARVLVHVDRLS